MRGRAVTLQAVQLPSSAAAPCTSAAAAAPPFEHLADVCAAEWNLMGTTLATSAMDGRVRLWTANLLGEWSERTPQARDSSA